MGWSLAIYGRKQLALVNLCPCCDCGSPSTGPRKALDQEAWSYSGAFHKAAGEQTVRGKANIILVAKQHSALVESKDGLHWSEPPRTVLSPKPETGWEDDIDRSVAFKCRHAHHLWYTGNSKANLRHRAPCLPRSNCASH